MNFEINLIFQTKKSRQKFNYLENEKSFYKIKSIFYPFKRPSLKQISRVFLEAESPTFRVEFHVSHTEGFQGLLLTSEVESFAIIVNNFQSLTGVGKLPRFWRGFLPHLCHIFQLATKNCIAFWISRTFLSNFFIFHGHYGIFWKTIKEVQRKIVLIFVCFPVATWPTVYIMFIGGPGYYMGQSIKSGTSKFCGKFCGKFWAFKKCQGIWSV